MIFVFNEQKGKFLGIKGMDVSHSHPKELI